MAADTAPPTEPSRRGPYRTGAQSRAELVQAASRVFAEHGYAGGSLRQIAVKVGMSAASLMQHFGSKQGLLEAVLANWREETDHLVSGDQIGLAFFRALRESMSYHVDHRGLIELFLTMATEASTPTHPAHAFIRARYDREMAHFRAQLLHAQKLGEIPAMDDRQVDLEVRALFAVMDGLELQWLLDPEIDLVGLFGAHLDITLARWGAADS